MATKIETICDACGKSIDRAKGFVNLNPLRGGIMLEVNNGTGSAGRNLTTTVNLCGPACLAGYAENLTAEIKPPAAGPQA